MCDVGRTCTLKHRARTFLSPPPTPTLTQMKLEHVDQRAANAEEEAIRQRSKIIISWSGMLTSGAETSGELLLWPTFDTSLILLQPHLMVMICPKSSS